MNPQLPRDVITRVLDALPDIRGCLYLDKKWHTAAMDHSDIVFWKNAPSRYDDDKFYDYIFGFGMPKMLELLTQYNYAYGAKQATKCNNIVMFKHLFEQRVISACIHDYLLYACEWDSLCVVKYLLSISNCAVDLAV
jgi:hypothetical protein